MTPLYAVRASGLQRPLSRATKSLKDTIAGRSIAISLTPTNDGTLRSGRRLSTAPDPIKATRPDSEDPKPAKSGNYWDMMRIKEEERPPLAPLGEYVRLDGPAAAKYRQPPRKAQMLTRDFVADALYNPHYGYFTKRANIFRWEQPPDFSQMRDEMDFMDRVAKLYSELEPEAAVTTAEGQRQLWHTPVELFRPWYGYAVAKYIVSKHRTRLLAAAPAGSNTANLLIFEVGGGNGTMMTNVLDYIRENEPDLYPGTKYTVIEISPLLSKQQAKLVAEAKARHPGITLINKSIFDWKNLVPDECFFIASEVIDNFAHDLVRFDMTTLEPRQGVVLVNENSDYSEGFEPVSDELMVKFLQLRESLGMQSPATRSMFLKKLRALLPFAPNLTEAEFLPTMAMELFHVLRDYFPKHHLVLADFSMLPDAVDGVNGPVVQIRHQGSMIPCTTYLVQPGRFDIFFPTDFDQLRALYSAICRPGGQGVTVETQRKFMEAWTDPEQTRTASGDRPILTMYKNMKWLLS